MKFILLFFVFLLSGCAPSPYSRVSYLGKDRYEMNKDGAGFKRVEFRASIIVTSEAKYKYKLILSGVSGDFLNADVKDVVKLCGDTTCYVPKYWMPIGSLNAGELARSVSFVMRFNRDEIDSMYRAKSAKFVWEGKGKRAVVDIPAGDFDAFKRYYEEVVL